MTDNLSWTMSAPRKLTGHSTVIRTEMRALIKSKKAKLSLRCLNRGEIGHSFTQVAGKVFYDSLSTFHNVGKQTLLLKLKYSVALNRLYLSNYFTRDLTRLTC